MSVSWGRSDEHLIILWVEFINISNQNANIEHNNNEAITASKAIKIGHFLCYLYSTGISVGIA